VAAATLVLAASAAGTTASATKTRHFNARVTALALDGSRAAYGLGSSTGHAN
jgi:hypothetical protein